MYHVSNSIILHKNMSKVVLLHLGKLAKIFREKVNTTDLVVLYRGITSDERQQNFTSVMKAAETTTEGEASLWRQCRGGRVDLGTSMRLKIGRFLLKRKGPAKHGILRVPNINFVHTRNVNGRK